LQEEAKVEKVNNLIISHLL